MDELPPGYRLAQSRDYFAVFGPDGNPVARNTREVCASHAWAHYGRTVFAERDTPSPGRDEALAALKKINEIRNSIIGAQGVNWSEHVYPLVAALNEAGITGLPYPEARETVRTLADRAERMETALKHIAATADTLSPQEFINVVADALGVGRHEYAGACDPQQSIVELTSAVKRTESDAKDLRAVLHKIAFDPIGEPEATVEQIYDDIVAIARAALLPSSARPSGEAGS